MARVCARVSVKGSCLRKDLRSAPFAFNPGAWRERRFWYAKRIDSCCARSSSNFTRRHAATVSAAGGGLCRSCTLSLNPARA